MSVKLSQQAILKVLNDLKLSPVWQQETEQVYIVLEIAKREVPIFFGIRSGNTLLQTIAYLPYDLPKTTFGQVARMLHLLNREIDMPGFGMDESQNLMFYRCVLPCLNGEFNEKLLEIALATTRVVCETFMDAIAMIAGGTTTVDAVVEETKKREQAKGTS